MYVCVWVQVLLYYYQNASWLSSTTHVVEIALEIAFWLVSVRVPPSVATENIPASQQTETATVGKIKANIRIAQTGRRIDRDYISCVKYLHILVYIYIEREMSHLDKFALPMHYLPAHSSHNTSVRNYCHTIYRSNRFINWFFGCSSYIPYANVRRFLLMLFTIEGEWSGRTTMIYVCRSTNLGRCPCSWRIVGVCVWVSGCECIFITKRLSNYEHKLGLFERCKIPTTKPIILCPRLNINKFWYWNIVFRIFTEQDLNSIYIWTYIYILYVYSGK